MEEIEGVLGQIDLAKVKSGDNVGNDYLKIQVAGKTINVFDSKLMEDVRSFGQGTPVRVTYQESTYRDVQGIERTSRIGQQIVMTSEQTVNQTTATSTTPQPQIDHNEAMTAITENAAKIAYKVVESWETMTGNKPSDEETRLINTIIMALDKRGRGY